METVLITGGTGLVGVALTKYLSGKGYAVIILTRKMPDQAPLLANVRYALWDVDQQKIDQKAISDADHIVHLAGAGVVAKPWTKAYKQLILDSRVQSSKLLAHTLQHTPNKVRTVVSASAIGWYGADPAPQPGGFVETDPAAVNFLGETCQRWEESIQPVKDAGKRLVILRLGIVLSKAGGALAAFMQPLRFGIAGILGGGKQVVSWVHIDDLCRAIVTALETERMQGVYNAVSPSPVTNKQLTLKLAEKLRGRFFIPLHVPGFVLRLVMGERSTEVLKSTTVNGDKIRQSGFSFLYPSLDAALTQLCSRK